MLQIGVLASVWASTGGPEHLPSCYIESRQHVRNSIECLATLGKNGEVRDTVALLIVDALTTIKAFLEQPVSSTTNIPRRRGHKKCTCEPCSTLGVEIAAAVESNEDKGVCWWKEAQRKRLLEMDCIPALCIIMQIYGSQSCANSLNINKLALELLSMLLNCGSDISEESMDGTLAAVETLLISSSIDTEICQEHSVLGVAVTLLANMMAKIFEQRKKKDARKSSDGTVIKIVMTGQIKTVIAGVIISASKSSNKNQVSVQTLYRCICLIHGLLNGVDDINFVEQLVEARFVSALVSLMAFYGEVNGSGERINSNSKIVGSLLLLISWLVSRSWSVSDTMAVEVLEAGGLEVMLRIALSEEGVVSLRRSKARCGGLASVTAAVFRLVSVNGDTRSKWRDHCITTMMSLNGCLALITTISSNEGSVIAKVGLRAIGYILMDCEDDPIDDKNSDDDDDGDSCYSRRDIVLSLASHGFIPIVVSHLQVISQADYESDVDGLPRGSLDVLTCVAEMSVLSDSARDVFGHSGALVSICRLLDRVITAMKLTTEWSARHASSMCAVLLSLLRLIDGCDVNRERFSQILPLSGRGPVSAIADALIYFVDTFDYFVDSEIPISEETQASHSEGFLLLRLCITIIDTYSVHSMNAARQCITGGALSALCQLEDSMGIPFSDAFEGVLNGLMVRLKNADVSYRRDMIDIHVVGTSKCSVCGAKEWKASESSDRITRVEGRRRDQGPANAQNRQGIKLYRCENCLGPFYCSNECQSRAWPSHKKECRTVGT